MVDYCFVPSRLSRLSFRFDTTTLADHTLVVLWFITILLEVFVDVVCGPDGVWVLRSEDDDGLVKLTVAGPVFRASGSFLSELRATPGVPVGSSFRLSPRAAVEMSSRMLLAAGFPAPPEGRALDSDRVIPCAVDVSAVSAVRDGVLVSLRPYQVDGCRWLISRGLHALLGDEMGLGKTVQVSVALEVARPVRQRALVVTTKSTLHNWPIEASWWAPSWTASAVVDTKSFRKVVASGADLLVVTWGMLTRLRRELLEWAPDTVICDEAHYLKEGYKTDRGCAIAALSSRALSTLLMTGTPLINRPSELWFLFHLLDPSSYPTFLPYAERFCAPVLSEVYVKGSRKTFMDYSGSSNQDDLAVALSGIQLRRKKSEVLVDLPALRETTCFVQPSTALRRAWLDALKKLSSDQALDPSSLQDFLSIYKQVGLEKVEAVVELASDIVSSGDGPVIVLIYNTDVHKALLESFARLGLRVCSIVGSTSASHRQSIVRDFQSGCYDVLIGSDAVREGVTLTRAHHVIQAQYWWTEAAMDQGHSRAHRFGQLLDVWVHYAHCRGTIDDHIVSAVKRKTGLREGIVEAAKSIVDEKILQILGGLS